MPNLNREKNYLCDEDYMDVLTERLTLVRDRIDTVHAENHNNIFAEVSDFLGRLFSILDATAENGIGAQGSLKKSMVRDKNHLKLLENGSKDLYRNLDESNYEDSYLNPDVAANELGDTGKFFSALFMELMGLIPVTFEGNIELPVIFSELFIELYDLVTENFNVETGDEVVSKIKAANFDKEEMTKAIKSISDAYQSHYHDYAEIFDRDSIVNLLYGDPYIYDVLMNADLSDPTYMYAYGEKIGKNEIGLYNYLNKSSEDDITAMARTYVKGYLDGFRITERDLSAKKTVRIIYPIGMERVARKSVLLFKEAGLDSVINEPGSFSYNRRNGGNGACSSSENRQALYDHSDDKSLYLNRAFFERKKEVSEDTYAKNAEAAGDLSGIALMEVFGREDFNPVTKDNAVKYTAEDGKLITEYMSVLGEIRNRYIPGDETSFTIISYPAPSIGPDFEKIFEETVKINNLDSDHWRQIQQYLIDALDKGDRVHITGTGENRTNIIVSLHPVTDPDRETKFENCVADVNIPAGEVFTSPRLEGTNGTLHVSHVFLGGYEFRNLELKFKDGMVDKIHCSNFTDESANRKLIDDHIMFHHDTLPLGEFAIGTNTLAYVMARKYDIESKMDILIAEKTGPHFAVGDTCYSYAEDVVVHNPDGKEIIARENSVSALRKTDPSRAYFHCHTDITIPYDELGKIEVISEAGETITLIENGRFVLPGTEELNKPLEEFIR